LSLAVFAGGVSASAAPAKVGDTRAVYGASGTILRTEPKATAAPVATLPRRTPVRVEEVRDRWLRVQASPAGREPVNGWLNAYEVIEAEKLAAAPPPAQVSEAGAARVNERDRAAAGRQFDSDTEQRYRRERVDLGPGYALVDLLEQETARIDTADAVEFMIGAAVGGPSPDLDRPIRLPAAPAPAPKANPIGGKVVDKAGEVLGGLLGGKRSGERLAKGGAAFLNGAIAARAERIASDFTTDQEYYLGRAVAAHAYVKFRPVADARLRAYVRSVGDAIVRASPKITPNFGGYHFDVLESDAVNAYSGPGGFVLVTRGAVQACTTEDEVAAILAHELAHIVGKHAENVLRASKRQQRGFTNLVSVGAAVADLNDARWTGALLDLFKDVAGDVVRTNSEHAYGSQFEFSADQYGAAILNDCWYDWWAMRDVLARIAESGHAHGSADHASPAQRIAMVEPHLRAMGVYTPKDWVRPERKRRLDEALGRAPPPVPADAAPPAPPPGPAPGFPPPR
jgi:Zn-dependent protease with chaperone function